MTVTDQIKTLNRKIKQNEAQYDLDREAAKISALPCNNLDKYEYLTGEDLGLKPSTIEKTKFDYSLFGKIFNKGLSEEDKKEGLLKKLKNIEDNKEQLLKNIEDNNKQLLTMKNKIEDIKDIRDIINSVGGPLSLEANALIKEIENIPDINYKKLYFKDGNKVEHDFSGYNTFKE